MKVQLTATSVIALAGVVVVAYVGWKVYKTGAGLASGIADAASDAAEWVGQQHANVVETWNNATSAPASGGDPTRQALYGEQGYGGIDPVTGESATAGEWWQDEEARRYEYHQQEMARLRMHRPAPVVGTNGAAFGVYPRP